MPRGSLVVELGCGTGLTTRHLTDHCSVIGVDFSSACLARARRSAPTAALVQADMTRVAFRPRSVDAVAGFYSLIHVPRDEQASVLRRAAEWIRPGGTLVVTMGADDRPATSDDDWRGVEMYWSWFDAATNLDIVRSAGFDVVHSEEVPQEVDGTAFTFLWVVGRRRR